ncbi:MAG: IS3 family transposase, partial [Christensenellaceae bacterium]
RRGNTYDNAVAENFFSIFKPKCISRQKIQSFEQAQQLIDDYIYFYNFERYRLKYRLTIFCNWLFFLLSILSGTIIKSYDFFDLL